MRTSGSEGGRRKPTRENAGRAPPADPTPACRPGRGSAAPPSSRGLFSRRIVGRGHQQPHGAPTTRSAPPGQAIRRRKHREGRCLTGLVHHSDHGSKSPVHRPRRTTRRRGHRSHRPEPWAPPTQAPPPRPWASPCKRGARSGATAPGRTATTSKSPPPSG